jgi:nucleoside-diphosphate-sugar epimerase
MSKRISKILVTGGAGFIGSHLVDRLLSEDYQVIVLDNLSCGDLKNISYPQNKNFRFLRGDIRNFGQVKAAVRDVDAVFHEAALVSVTQSVQDPILANSINVTGTLNVLKASADSGVKRLMFASSAAVYGESSTPEKIEDGVLSPLSPYGISKLAAENYTRSFYEVYGLETVSLRYFNVYGPRQSFDISNAYGGVITIFLNRLLRNMPPIIYGQGDQTRDFVYVEDIVEANMLALKTKNAAGDYFNIGSGGRVSVTHIAEALKRLLKKENIQNTYADARPGEVKHTYANIEKARRILGYCPRFSFDEGLAKLVGWYSKNYITR